MNIDKETWKERAEVCVRRITEWQDSMVQYMKDNPQVAAAFTGAAAIAIKQLLSHAKQKSDTNHKERSIWDASTGQWYLTNRPMTNAQKSEFARRKANGERTDQILISMRLL